MTTAYLLSDKPLIFDGVPPELAEKYPIEETLRILGFEENSLGNLERSWGHLTVKAGPWIGCWQLMFSTKWRSERELPIPYEMCIRVPETPIVILSIIHEAWKYWFRRMETPSDLLMGKEFGDRNWQAVLDKYNCRPTLWAEREFFRFCVGYLEKQYDWPEEDCDVEFSYADGQLKLRAKDIEVHCPARGKFNGRLTLSARHLFRYMPKRFTAETIFIQVTDNDKVIIGSRLLNAQWVENQNSEMP
jgi:hypothetical protein